MGESAHVNRLRWDLPTHARQIADTHLTSAIFDKKRFSARLSLFLYLGDGIVWPKHRLFTFPPKRTVNIKTSSDDKIKVRIYQHFCRCRLVPFGFKTASALNKKNDLNFIFKCEVLITARNRMSPAKCRVTCVSFVIISDSRGRLAARRLLPSGLISRTR